jgi:hypothetical protein
VTEKDDEYLTTVEFAAMVRKTPNAILLMRSRGTAPPAYEVNGRLLWKRSDVVAWVERNVSAVTKPTKRTTVTRTGRARAKK